jgi:hypothetical protein
MRRVDRLVLDAELTDRIIHAKVLRAELGHWPTAIPGLETSQMPGGRWVYAVRGDGGMTISFSRELEWDDEQEMILPSRYESE